MTLQAVSTTNAPAAIGPYSQGIVVNGQMIFTAGQTGFVPATMQLAEGGVQGQTRQVLENLKAVLEAAGSGMDRVVKTTVYLKDMGDFAAMNEIYATYFGAPPPARTTIEAARLPKDALVEIECIALI
ncbi:MAG: RidA family protein [Anaerolineae bacterium]|nr:RidA family protein [Anaerolineae bacterium]